MLLPLSGLVAGTLGARLLRVLPRGADVGWLWCALPTAALWATTVAAADVPGRWLPVPLLLSWLVVLFAVTDYRHRRLPDALTLPAYPVLALVLWFAGADLGRSVIGCLLFFGVHWAVHRWRPSALGGGDVKLAGALGAVLGAVSWLALPVAAGVASAITLVGALRRSRCGLPHGPGLTGATWLTSVWGPW
ncbi:A24 family peptidase [Actinosynnema sp. NPDC023587]|uniref:A24 family peptidase n=1 Tax=Actinosynnema sp. NPDC023587 TaxID=3154695 RepID=UPI00340A501D